MALNINGTTGISGVDGSASAPALQGTDSNTGINFGSDTVNINTGGSTRATVDSAGNLGLGTTSPSGTLHIASSSEYCLKINKSDSTAAYIQFYNSTTGSLTSDGFRLGIDSNEDALISLRESGNMKFATTNTERMRIDSSGRLLIGCTSLPNGSADGIGLLAANGERNFSRGDTATRDQIVFYNPNGLVGRIQTSSSSTSYVTSSDYRLKENATAISDGITRLKTLKPYRFNFKAEATTILDGFFAHEVTAVPEAITGTKDEVDSDDKPIYQGIDQSKLVPLLTAALQEAVAKLEVLETKVAALETA